MPSRQVRENPDPQAKLLSLSQGVSHSVPVSPLLDTKAKMFTSTAVERRDASQSVSRIIPDAILSWVCGGGWFVECMRC